MKNEHPNFINIPQIFHIYFSIAEKRHCKSIINYRQ